jgi:nitroreductase
MKNVKKMPEEIFQNVQGRYKSFQESDLPMLDNDRALYDWSCRQTYIALGNMMTAVALIGIYSCPIEGFDYQAVNDILEKRGLLEDGKLRVLVMAAFGYREEAPIRPKTRKKLNQIVKWVN